MALDRNQSGGSATGTSTPTLEDRVAELESLHSFDAQEFLSVESDGYAESLTIPHGFVTDNIDIGFKIIGTDSGAVDGTITDANGYTVYQSGSGALARDFTSGSTPASGNIAIRVRNQYSNTQNIAVHWWARKRESAETPLLDFGYVSFNSATYTVAEDAGSATITVIRTGGSAGSVNVNYVSSDGTATAGVDYTAVGASLTFLDGETTKTFTVNITSDSLSESDETVNLSLINHSGGVGVGNQSTAVLTIVNSDRPHETILSDVTGFAGVAGTTGGKNGTLVEVSNLNASGAGSLRQAILDASGPTWIKFNSSLSGTIAATSKTFPKSNMTIDGRGADITISQLGFRIVSVTNVVITHIKTASMDAAQDSFNINKNASKVWINHCDIAGGTDEGLDISNSGIDGVDESPTDITISYCHFSGNLKSALLGGATTPTSDANIRVTMEHCYLETDNERMPKCNWGKYHLYNNFIYNPDNIATLVTEQAQAYVEGNVYEDGAAGGTTAIWAGIGGGDTYTGYAANVNNVLLGSMSNGGTAVDSSAPYSNVFTPSSFYSYTAADPSGDSGSALKTDVTTNAGWLSVSFPS